MAARADRIDLAGTFRPALPDVLEEHLEEVGFLAVQRRPLLFSPEAPRRRLQALDGRIEAHLDGLRTGGTASVELSLERMDDAPPFLRYACVRVWVELARPGLSLVLERLVATDDEARASWREAFRRLPAEATQRLFPIGSLSLLPGAALEVALDALGWHGLLTPAIAQAYAVHASTGVRRTVARHARDARMLTALLSDPALEVRRVALWSLALAAPSLALDWAHPWARTATPDAFALRVLGLLGDRAEGATLVAALSSPVAFPAAVQALVDLGRPEHAGALLADLPEGDQPSLARDAFWSLVGREGAVLPEGARWSQLVAASGELPRRWHGVPHPWTGTPADEPLAFQWRAALGADTPDGAALRREVPDGFFTGVPSDVALAGE